MKRSEVHEEKGSKQWKLQIFRIRQRQRIKRREKVDTSERKQ